MRLAVTVFLGAVATLSQHHSDPFIGTDCDCERFCRYECAINATKGPVKQTFYRMTMDGVYDLVDKNTGDAAGDTSFVIAKKNNAYFCRKNPDDFGCTGLAQFTGDDATSTDKILEFTVEVDGQWGPYLECNPINASLPVGRWSCENGINISPAGHLPAQCRALQYQAFSGYCITSKPDHSFRGSFGDCCSFIGNSTAGAYQMYNYVPSSSTCALFAHESHQTKKCDNDATLGVYSPPDPNQCTCERLFRSVGRQNQTTHNYGNLGIAGGLWFSHPSGGRCGKNQQVGDNGCTYKVLDVPRAINATCMYKTIDQFVEGLNPTCFNRCHKPFNVTSDCYLFCFSETTKHTPKERLSQPWGEAFAADGCPQIPMTEDLLTAIRKMMPW